MNVNNYSETGKDDQLQQFEALFNFATIGIVVTNQNGRIINFNKCAETQFGYSREEILGKAVEELIPNKFHSSHIKHRNYYYHHPEPRSMGAGRDLYAKRKDNSVFPVEVSLSHYVVNGHTFVMAFVIDITVRKNSEVEVLLQKQELETITNQLKQFNVELEQKVGDRTKMLRETLAELEKSKTELSEALVSEKELSDLKYRFVTLASHEFRTPLSTILSSAYLLEQYTDNSGKTKKHIQRIKNAVAGMKSILEDFLSLGKLEEGLIEIRKENITAEVCRQDIQVVLEEMEQMLKHEQKINFSHLGNANMIIDRHLLKNIVMNLVSNAIKFSPEGSVIEVSANFKDNELEVVVLDHGLGISEEDQQHLFQRFFRGKNVSNIQGTGLGLHIIGNYLELLNGSIAFKSSVNGGSIFTFNIPSI
ncbi:MAG: PAS domain-containing sensor histidine kinase [Chitinophagaceae bacterium]